MKNPLALRRSDVTLEIKFHVFAVLQPAAKMTQK